MQVLLHTRCYLLAALSVLIEEQDCIRQAAVAFYRDLHEEAHGRVGGFKIVSLLDVSLPTLALLVAQPVNVLQRAASIQDILNSVQLLKIEVDFLANNFGILVKSQIFY